MTTFGKPLAHSWIIIMVLGDKTRVNSEFLVGVLPRDGFTRNYSKLDRPLSCVLVIMGLKGIIKWP